MTLHERIFEESDRKMPDPQGIDATHLTKGLWIGSKPEIGRVVGGAGFDLLVLCAEEYQPPSWDFPGVKVIHAPFDDNDIGPTPTEKDIAKKAAKKVAAALREGSNILVTCYAGINRSAYVTGLALVEIGYEPVQAIALIKQQRPGALSNRFFEKIIRSTR
jgi:hypothetical protein